MYKDTREKMHEACNKTIEDVSVLETGSEEHTRAVKDAVLMYNAQVEEWKQSEDLEDKRWKLQRDHEIEKEKLAAEERKRVSELSGKAIVAVALLGSTVLSLKEQREGYLVPREVTRFGGDLLKIFKF